MLPTLTDESERNNIYKRSHPLKLLPTLRGVIKSQMAFSFGEVGLEGGGKRTIQIQSPQSLRLLSGEKNRNVIRQQQTNERVSASGDQGH